VSSQRDERIFEPTTQDMLLPGQGDRWLWRVVERWQPSSGVTCV